MDKGQARILGGRSVNWKEVSRSPGQPLITIITSTFNAGKDLCWTAKSIEEQTYPFIQWIIVDGDSKDDTLDYIKQYEGIVDIWFSEPDNGIYDAWNKAVKYAKGDWVQFVGAGDELAEHDTLEKVSLFLSSAHPEHDLVYGNLLYITEISRTPLEQVGQPWHKMAGKWELFRPKLPVHPEIFHHCSILNLPEPFDTRFKIAGDSHFLMRNIKVKPPLYVDILIDKMPMGGVSGSLSATLKASQETKRASRELGFSPPIYHVAYENVKLLTKRAIFNVFPAPLAKKIADYYRILSGKKPRWTKY